MYIDLHGAVGDGLCKAPFVAEQHPVRQAFQPDLTLLRDSAVLEKRHSVDHQRSNRFKRSYVLPIFSMQHPSNRLSRFASPTVFLRPRNTRTSAYHRNHKKTTLIKGVACFLLHLLLNQTAQDGIVSPPIRVHCGKSPRAVRYWILCGQQLGPWPQFV
jgi:hypothetical protein